MTRCSRRTFLSVAAAASTAATTGCLQGAFDDAGAGETGEDDDGPPEIPYSSLDLVDVEDEYVTALVHVDHWHLHPVEVPVDGDRRLRFRFDDELTQKHAVEEHEPYARIVSHEGGSVVMGSGEQASAGDEDLERDGDYEVDVEGDVGEIDEDDVLEEEVEEQDIVDVEGTEDGVVLQGLEEGSVTVVFTLEGDDEVVYSSPPVEVLVS